ncbi:glycosyltransferase [Alkalibacillus haloalkaliphilus]|uniref:glycosyltransferase n=1 Tax=Alkalibacillus haloalkaliphilus TaxID=94136 RepID=UPI0029366794|nr:glycosyltransferase [Alkalibacillus haloalkaliphilus]MDV2582165.1 glycosyltransferase [Alkalibacillus haloalkaliphilus]
MLVYIITPLFPTKDNEVIGTFVYEQCKALVDRGYDVVVLNVTGLGWKNWNNNKMNEINEGFIEGVKFYNYYYRSVASAKFPLREMRKCENILNKMYEYALERHGCPDLIHLHFSFPLGKGVKNLAIRNKVPLVVTEHHSMFLNRNINNYLIKEVTSLVKNSSSFICVSTYLKESLESYIKTSVDIKVVPNMIDNRFEYHKLKSSTNNFDFLSIGSFRKIKKHDLLVKSFIKAFKESDRVSLRIVGTGKEKRKVKKIIKKNNREKQILLLGSKRREEVLEEIIACDCFTLASKDETFGVVYREAMAVGRPVVSTNNGGVLESWSDSYGVLAKKNDIEDLSNKLRYMYMYSKDFNHECISNQTLERYSENSVINMVIKVYEKTLKDVRT